MYLGIDPGVRKLGYALIDNDLNIIDAGILLNETKKISREENYDRIISIYDFFEKFIKENKIKVVGIEKLFFTKFNQSNAEFVYGIRGALIALFLKHGISIKEYTPIQLKKILPEMEEQKKILVQKFIKKLFTLQDLPEYDDAADALGLAYLSMKK